MESLPERKEGGGCQNARFNAQVAANARLLKEVATGRRRYHGKGRANGSPLTFPLPPRPHRAEKLPRERVPDRRGSATAVLVLGNTPRATREWCEKNGKMENRKVASG